MKNKALTVTLSVIVIVLALLVVHTGIQVRDTLKANRGFMDVLEIDDRGYVRRDGELVLYVLARSETLGENIVVESVPDNFWNQVHNDQVAVTLQRLDNGHYKIRNAK